MSSILEALKKLEAEKNAHQMAVEAPEPAYTSDQMAQSLLGNFADSIPRPRHTSPLFLILGGSLFTLLFIGVTVSLAVFVLKSVNGAPAPTQAAAQPTPAPAIAPVLPSPAPAQPTAVPMVKTDVPVKTAAEVVAAAPAPKPKPKPAPAPESIPLPDIPMVATSVSAASEVRYEPYVPKPATEHDSTPVPEDIRKLPMLSRSERSQYRLEGLTINMLNEASATRPLGNALINLEKIFIGETLPGTNATLIDVKSHGIAIEIMSTHQRYYIPR